MPFLLLFVGGGLVTILVVYGLVRMRVPKIAILLLGIGIFFGSFQIRDQDDPQLMMLSFVLRSISAVGIVVGVVIHLFWSPANQPSPFDPPPEADQQGDDGPKADAP